MNNNVLNILKEFLEWEQIKEDIQYTNLSYEEKDKLRVKYDNDVKYYYHKLKMERGTALKADTIISFWTIYKKLLKEEANWNAVKNLKSLKNLIYQIETSRDTGYSENIKKLNMKIDKFAAIYYTKGNYMLLPCRGMNNERYQISEDRIDVSIYECFDNGKLSKFFTNQDTLMKWIENQSLTKLFKDEKIRKDNIKWFVNDEEHKKISDMNKEELYRYLEKAIDLINYRNSI